MIYEGIWCRFRRLARNNTTVDGIRGAFARNKREEVDDMRERNIRTD
jgi:hypothetical protein